LGFGIINNEGERNMDMSSTAQRVENTDGTFFKSNIYFKNNDYWKARMLGN
jgi:hypothetical protein